MDRLIPLNLERLKSDRKRRLFACACARETWHLLQDDRSRKAVEVAEAFADGVATGAELRLAWGAAWAVAKAANRDVAVTAAWVAREALRIRKAAGPFRGVARAARDEARTARDAARAARDAAHAAARAARGAARGAARDAARACRDIAWQRHRLLLDDLAGPDPLPSLPRTQTVVTLARAIYDLRRWQDLPILADALEEAGCTHTGILSHLRGPGPHARGCHVVDLLLQRE
jgi:hypothetical protein